MDYTPHAPFSPMATSTVPRRDRSSWERPQLASQDEAAYRLGVSRTTIWRLIAAGEIQPVRIGSRTLVSNKSVDEFVARQSRNGGTK